MKSRRYANFWEFPDEAARDKGIVDSLLYSLGPSFPPVALGSLRSRGRDDPPDCDATLIDGSRVAFELTDLVDEKGVRDANSKKAGPPFVEFDEARAQALIAQRITAKRRDVSALKGGPYARRVLVLHTAEAMLGPDLCDRAIAAHPVPNVPPWTDVFILFPPPVNFDGNEQFEPTRYPVLRIL